MNETKVWSVLWLVGTSGATISVFTDKLAALKYAADTALEQSYELAPIQRREFLQAYEQGDWLRCIGLYQETMKDKEVLEVAEGTINKPWFSIDVKYHHQKLAEEIQPPITLVCTKTVGPQASGAVEVSYRILSEEEGHMMAKILMRNQQSGILPKRLLNGSKVVDQWFT